MRAKLLVFAIVAAHAHAAAGQTATGVVVDPQDRVVAGAVVRLVCAGERRAEVVTGEDGRFGVPRARSGVSDCVLEITREGFEPLRLRPADAVSLDRIALRLAGVRETIHVRALPDERTPSLNLTPMLYDAAELETTGADVTDWLLYVRSAAGGANAPGDVLVDGMRSGVLPARAAIAAVTVSFDRFSVEFADSDAARIDVVTCGPDRRFDVGVGLSGPSRGARHPLSQGQRATSRMLSVGASGAMPWTPFTFLVEGRDTRRASPSPVIAPLAPDAGAQVTPATTETSDRSLSFLTAWSRPGALEFRANVHASTERIDNAGVGELTLPEAAVAVRSSVRELRVTLEKTGSTRRYRTGLSVLAVDSASEANRDGLAVRVSGSAVAGGAPETQATRSQVWTWKTAIEPRGRGAPWLAGAELSGSRFEIVEWPNRFGLLQFPSPQAYLAAIDGEASGTWFHRPGRIDVAAETLQASAFAQRDVWRSSSWQVRAGLRADLQRGDGLRVSPRVSATARLRGAVVRAGAGVFVRNYFSTLFAEAARSAPAHPLFAVPSASIAVAERPEDALAVARSIVSEMDPAFRRAQDAVASVSIERRIGVLTSTVEYTFTRGEHLPGSRRSPSASGWVDRLESAYRLRVHQVLARGQLRWGAQNLTANYQWTRSVDTSGGPFSFAEAADPERSAWARTAGMPPHALQVAASLKLRGGVSLTAVGSASAGAPFDVTTGQDAGNLLFLDRAGRARNSGVGRAQRQLSLFVHRRFAMPILGDFGRRHPVAIGVRADNVFGWRNYVTLGSVVGSALFGRPLSALPGRSVKLSVTW